MLCVFLHSVCKPLVLTVCAEYVEEQYGSCIWECKGIDSVCFYTKYKLQVQIFMLVRISP